MLVLYVIVVSSQLPHEGVTVLVVADAMMVELKVANVRTTVAMTKTAHLVIFDNIVNTRFLLNPNNHFLGCSLSD